MYCAARCRYCWRRISDRRCTLQHGRLHRTMQRLVAFWSAVRREEDIAPHAGSLRPDRRSGMRRNRRRSVSEYYDHCCFHRLRCRFALILQCKVQAVNQTEEVGVTVSCNAVSTVLQEVIRTVGVTAEFRQYVGRGRLRRRSRRSYDHSR